ncbi:MAG: DUF2325 domain-containing protein, partial [Cyanobacteria bacterium J06649_4]
LRLQRSETEKSGLQERVGQLVGKIAVLENRLDLRTYSETDSYDSDSAIADDAPFASSETSLLHLSTPSSAEPVDLSNISLALIGGHETTYREVTAELKQYGLKRCIHVPPHSIASNNRQQIKDKISNCDLIITITSYVDHSVSKCVKQLKDTQMLAGECIRVSCHGKSGLVREVLQYFENPLRSPGAV